MTIPAEDLEQLEEQVKDWMASGQWQKALEEIRAAAVLYGESRDDLARKVVARAFQAGHVKPIMETPG